MNQKIIYLLLVVGLICGVLVRLKDFRAPLADWHSFRQADTASVAREYVKHGINLLEPKYHDLGSIQSGKDNPEGYRMVEFPLVNGVVAYLYRTFQPPFELHVFYRLVNLTLSIISGLLLFLIVKRLANPTLGLISSLVFLFLPFSIFYSRTILPEVGLITFSLLAVYAGINFIDKPTLLNYFFSLVALSLGLLTKPVAVFFYLPLIGYMLHKRRWQATFLIFALTPLYFWRRHILAYPEGIPDSIWLFNGNHIRFKGAWFYWLFADRLGRLILGYWGTILVGLGILVKKKSSVIMWWLAGAVAYLAVFATGNVQHDYYQIPLLPIISILIAYGIHFLLTTKSFPKITSISLLVVSVFFSFSFSWYHIRAYYGINNPAIVSAGQAVDRLTPPDSLIIAPYMGDTAFLYQTNRRGWPIGFDIDDKIAKGADYYVTVNFDDEANALMKTYTLVEKTDQYLILDLKTKI